MSSAKGRRSAVLEREVEAYLQSQVLAHGGFCYLVAPRGTKGPPDTVIVWPRDGWAQIHLVEVKTVGGALDHAQERFHAALAKFNCHVRVMWTKEQVDRYIEEYGARTSDASVTLASLLAGKMEWPGGVKYDAVQVPRRRKKAAIQLAPPPADEFTSASECICDGAAQRETLCRDCPNR